MDLVQYVNNVGKQINDHTKISIDIDNLSVTNLVLINHLDQLKAEAISRQEEQEVIEMINNCINHLKKEMRFYPVKDADDNCILTETEQCIIQE